jgi:hypothetical protein
MLGPEVRGPGKTNYSAGKTTKRMGKRTARR